MSILVLKQIMEIFSDALGGMNFSGPFRTWKRWGKLYNERRKKPSTEEREQRLQKMLERFKKKRK